MKQENRVVNGLWIGSKLSSMELLTIKSFLAHGHVFRLWLYAKLENELPQGVQIMDANSILSSDHIFSYKHSNQFGHGKGSVSGFSDIFRYKLLYDHGGWWVDMDVTCLSPLNVEKPYYFRPHHNLMLVGNVMKCPKGNELMLKCYQEASATVDENNTDWHRPINILVENVKRLQLQQYIVAKHSARDSWGEVKKYLFSPRKLPQNWAYIHWMNEEWRHKKLNESGIKINSAYHRLLRQYHLTKTNANRKETPQEAFQFLFLRYFG